MGLRKVFFIIILYLLSINTIQALEPDVFVQSTVNRASQVLSKNISKEEKMDQLKTIATETVDIEGIGYYSLGSARKQLSEVEKEKFSNLINIDPTKAIIIKVRSDTIWISVLYGLFKFNKKCKRVFNIFSLNN